MKHAALLIPGLDRLGGAERQVILVAKGLRQRGWRVTVVALSGSGGASAAELAGAEVGFFTLGMRKGLADLRGWVRFWRWVRRERPDVVHAHLAHAAFLGRWSRLFVPVPVVIDTLHSSSPGPFARRLGYRISRWLPDRVTAVSEAAGDAHLRAGMVSRRKLVVVPNGIDTEAFQADAEERAAVRRELGVSNEFLWLAAGRLEPVKDYPTLLQAMTGVRGRGRLLIAGAGPMQDELVRLAARLGLKDRVQFIGFAADVRRWMRAADALVLSSSWEGLPMAVLEAAACGLPAIGTNVPGTREAIADGETGWLVRPGDPAALARAMRALMDTHADERREMGARARQRVIERFSLEHVLDEWERLYDELSARPVTAGGDEARELGV